MHVVHAPVAIRDAETTSFADSQSLRYPQRRRKTPSSRSCRPCPAMGSGSDLKNLLTATRLLRQCLGNLNIRQENRVCCQSAKFRVAKPARYQVVDLETQVIACYDRSARKSYGESLAEATVCETNVQVLDPVGMPHTMGDTIECCSIHRFSISLLMDEPASKHGLCC